MVYSLYYNEHRGWYSFVLQSAYGFLLTFGFIAMTPQLFINYKVSGRASPRPGSSAFTNLIVYSAQINSSFALAHDDIQSAEYIYR
jgi:hypothetical protein